MLKLLWPANIFPHVWHVPSMLTWYLQVWMIKVRVFPHICYILVYPMCIVRMCVFKLLWPVNVFPHIWQVSSILTWYLKVWTIKVRVFPHIVYILIYPMCIVRMCVFKLHWPVNVFPHIWHIPSMLTWYLQVWTSKALLFISLKQQPWHSNNQQWNERYLHSWQHYRPSLVSFFQLRKHWTSYQKQYNLTQDDPIHSRSWPIHPW